MLPVFPRTSIYVPPHSAQVPGGWHDMKGSITTTVLQFLLGGGGSFSSGGPGAHPEAPNPKPSSADASRARVAQLCDRAARRQRVTTV